MVQRVVIESLVLLLAFLTGFSAFKKMQKYERVCFLQLIIWMIFYGISHIIILRQAMHHEVQNNQWLYNISTFIEIALLLMAAYFFYDDSKIKKLITVCLLIYMSIDLFTLYAQGWQKFNVIGFVIGTMFITIWYAHVLYTVISKRTEQSGLAPMFWICTGILLFYVCNLPYFSFFNYLNTNHLQLSVFFYKIITQVLANIRYLFLGLGFWLVMRKTLSST